MIYQIPKLFPNPDLNNLVICVSANYKDGSILISDHIPDLHFNGDTQAFPLYYYEERPKNSPSLFDAAGENAYVRRDGISDFILDRARKQYGKNVTKEDIFYYVYGFLHSTDYRETFANDLKKMLPRLPLVENVKDFWAFSKAGRQLADLHLNYETVPSFPGVTVSGDDGQTYTVQQMRFPKGQKAKDKPDTIHYNSKITISGIPAKAYEYVVNGKSAIEWIMERYAVTTHKESGITNDPNDWAKEVGNPRYILDLLLSIINVSMQTVDIVSNLPKLDFGTEPTDEKVVKLYPYNEEDEKLNEAAEKVNKE
jgi:predicted helicase